MRGKKCVNWNGLSIVGTKMRDTENADLIACTKRRQNCLAQTQFFRRKQLDFWIVTRVRVFLLWIYLSSNEVYKWNKNLDKPLECVACEIVLKVLWTNTTPPHAEDISLVRVLPLGEMHIN